VIAFSISELRKSGQIFKAQNHDAELPPLVFILWVEAFLVSAWIYFLKTTGFNPDGE